MLTRSSVEDTYDNLIVKLKQMQVKDKTNTDTAMLSTEMLTRSGVEDTYDKDSDAG